MNLKKSVTVLVFLCVAMVTYAQSWSSDFQFGLRAGINVSNVSGDYFDSSDARTSIYGGLVAEVPLTERVSLQPELFYSGQGFDTSGNETFNAAEYKIGYLQVPVFAKVYLIEGLNIHAGPQFGFKVNEEVDIRPGNPTGSTQVDAIRDFDFQLGGGVEYKFIQGFFVQARYFHGITEVINDTDMYNSVFSVGIGYVY